MEAEPLPYIYSGVLDDVVQRYEIGGALDDHFFNRMIAKSIFFSGGFLLNDGYLVNHPVSRRELMREDSTLRVMMRTDNFVRVLTRSDSAAALADMPEMMAGQGNTSFQHLVKSSEWPEFKRCLGTIASKLYRSSNVVRWPNRAMQIGFSRLLRPALRRSPAELRLSAAAGVPLEELEASFVAMAPEEGGARDKFEKAAISVSQKRVRDPSASVRELMGLANQAYHYNFGMCLTPEADWPITVDTQAGDAFAEFLVPDCEFGAAFGEVLQRIPIVRVPSSFPFEQGGIFADLLDSATQIGGAKTRYLHSLEAVFASSEDSLEAALADAEDAAQAYERRIVEHFGRLVGSRFAETYLDSVLAVTVGMISQLLPGDAMVNFLGGVAISIAANEALRGPRAFLLRRIRQRQVANELDRSVPALDPDRYFVSSAAELKPVFASMAFNRQAAIDFAQSVPPLRPSVEGA